VRILDAGVGLLVPSAASAGGWRLAISPGVQALLSAGLISSRALKTPSTGESLTNPLRTPDVAFARSYDDSILSPAQKVRRATDVQRAMLNHTRCSCSSVEHRLRRPCSCPLTTF
jgi:hypothetical protein